MNYEEVMKLALERGFIFQVVKFIQMQMQDFGNMDHLESV